VPLVQKLSLLSGLVMGKKLANYKFGQQREFGEVI
jgi:hypothetical protein